VPKVKKIEEGQAHREKDDVACDVAFDMAGDVDTKILMRHNMSTYMG